MKLIVISVRVQCVFLAGFLFSHQVLAADATTVIIQPTPDIKDAQGVVQWDPNWRWLYVSYLDLKTPIDLTGKNQNEIDQALAAMAAEARKNTLTWYTPTKPEQLPPTANQAPELNHAHTTAWFGKLYEYNDTREFISSADKQGFAVAFIYINHSANGCDADITISYDEKARQQLVSTELAQLAKHASGIADLLAIQQQSLPGESLPKAQVLHYALCMYVQPYALVQDRAIVTITATPPKDTLAGGANKDQTATTTIKTGSPEHSFFTVDALYMGTADVEYDSTSKSFKGKQDPNKPMIAYNYMVGDPYKNYDWNSWQRFAFKFGAVTGSPKDLFGPGIGYLFKTDLFDSNNTAGSFMLFVSYLRTVGNTGQRTYSWRWGLSYNFGAFGTAGSTGTTAQNGSK